MHPTVTERRFRYGQARASELQKAIDEILAELRNDTSEATARAHQAGLDPQALAATEVSVREEKQGVEPGSIEILVSIATGLGTHIATRLWDEVIWPRLRKRLGAKPLGPEVK